MEMALSIGSNIADRLANLQEARTRLNDVDGFLVTEQSLVYDTVPVGVPAANRNDHFLNAVLIVLSSLPLRISSQRIHQVEDAMGRRRTSVRNSPRRIDIDMVYADEHTSQCDDLVLPHPRWHERRFVVEPLADVRPERVVPEQTRSVRAILDRLPRSPEVVAFASDW